MSGPGEQGGLERVLIATRSPLARRLIASFKARRVETVVAFSAADAEAPWLEDADFDAFLGDGESARVWSDPEHLVSSAMDAGCDVIHPGSEPVADALDLWSKASAANVAVIGGDPRRMPEVLDRTRWIARARRLELPVLPVSDVVPVGEDGVAQAARVGVPLFAKAVHGPWSARASGFDQLARALAEVRQWDPNVLLERAIDETERLSVVVVADQHRRVVPLACLARGGDGILRATAASVRGFDLVQASVRLVHDSTFVGVGSVSWRVGRDGSAWLGGFGARLPSALALVEAAAGLDLVAVQHTVALGGHAPPSVAQHPAAQVTVRATTEGEAGRILLPERPGVAVELHGWSGRPMVVGDPLLVVTATGSHDAEAERRLVDALASARVDGVGSDLDLWNRRLGAAAR